MERPQVSKGQKEGDPRAQKSERRCANQQSTRTETDGQSSLETKDHRERHHAWHNIKSTAFPSQRECHSQHPEERSLPLDTSTTASGQTVSSWCSMEPIVWR